MDNKPEITEAMIDAGYNVLEDWPLGGNMRVLLRKAYLAMEAERNYVETEKEVEQSKPRYPRLYHFKPPYVIKLKKSATENGADEGEAQ